MKQALLGYTVGALIGVALLLWVFKLSIPETAVVVAIAAAMQLARAWIKTKENRKNGPDPETDPEPPSPPDGP